MTKEKWIFRNGFTLMELLLVITVVALISVVTVPSVNKMIDAARTTTAQREMMELVRTIVGDPNAGDLGYLQEMGRLPNGAAVPDFKELYARTVAEGAPVNQSPYNPFTRTGWNGPYIDMQTIDPDGDGDTTDGIEPEYDILFDPWGNRYVYSATNATITSLGPDSGDAGDDIIVEIQ